MRNSLIVLKEKIDILWSNLIVLKVRDVGFNIVRDKDEGMLYHLIRREIFVINMNSLELRDVSG